MRITKFQRGPDGSHKANVTMNSTTLTFTDAHGVWGTLPDAEGRWREAKLFVAEALQAKLPRAEKGRR